MSLSSETQRVQQGVKDTLKTLIQKLGGTVASERVDGYPSLANAISNKLLPDNLLSAATAALYGKPGTATPNDVFADIFTRLGGKAEIHTFTYVGTGTYNEPDSPNSVTADKPILLCGILFYKDSSGKWDNTTNGRSSDDDPVQFMLASTLSESYAEGVGFGDVSTSGSDAILYGKKSSDGKTFSWYAERGGSANQFNTSGTTYYGFYIC